MRPIVYDVASIGFGVQSTAIALMAGMDLIPRPDAYYFSELRETQETIDYIGYIMPILHDLGVDVNILKPKDIYEHILNWDTLDRVSMIPVWFRNTEGKPQPLNRQCTADFKIEIVASAIRKDLGVKKLKRNSIRIWQGISTDEIARAKRTALFPEHFRVNHYPFIAHFAGVTYPSFNWESYSRQKIIDNVFKANCILTPPKSSCFFCPFHDIEYWYHIYISFPDQWILACELDEKIRYYNTKNETLVSAPFYLYVGLIPLKDIDFDKELLLKKKGLISGCQTGFCFV